MGDRGDQEEKFSSVEFSHSVMSDSLWPHELQHARPPCPSPTPGVHPNPCPLSQWCHPTISILCRLLLLMSSLFPSIRVFSNESALCIRWPQYWSFSFYISPYNEHPGLISFRMDRLDHLAVQGLDSTQTNKQKQMSALALKKLYSFYPSFFVEVSLGKKLPWGLTWWSCG